MTHLKKITVLLFFVIVFVTFFNGYKTAGPARSKFKKLGTGEVDLTKTEETVEVNKLKEIIGDKRLKKWAGWWQACAKGFSLSEMEDIGHGPVYDERIRPLSTSEMGDGPGKMFYLRSPDGKIHLNPHWSRLLFKKEGDAWQPLIEIPCGVALYKPKENWARNILDCSALEGIDDAFWFGKERFALMGYMAVSRQMDVECETVESCVAPTVWIVDLKSGLINEHRGKLIKRNQCELGGYLKIRLPEFFEGQ